jgi:hypothetical protein
MSFSFIGQFNFLDPMEGCDYLCNKRRAKPMAQRRSEKPRKVKISPKQQEFYARIGKKI